MPLEPKINDAIRKALKTRSQSREPANAILQLADFYEFVLQHVPLVELEDLPSLTTVLDMQADVSHSCNCICSSNIVFQLCETLMGVQLMFQQTKKG